MQKNSFLFKIYIFFGSGFFSGFFPKAPGTAGSFLALVFWFFIKPDIITQVSVILFTVLIGIHISSILEKFYGKDSQIIVIDEFAGMFISLFLIDLTIVNILLAFILFRFFDIVKPFGIKSLQKLNGGFGVMIDDIIAGIITTIILHLILFIGINT